MAELYEIQKGVPVPSSDKKQPGLTKLIREMECGDSIVIPGDKISSAHPCAAQAKAKVRTQKNPDGTVTIWRISSVIAPKIDEPAPIIPVASSSEWPKIEPTVASGPNLPEGYYFRAGPYTSRVWIQGKPPVENATKPAPNKSIFD